MHGRFPGRPGDGVRRQGEGRGTARAQQENQETASNVEPPPAAGSTGRRVSKRQLKLPHRLMLTICTTVLGLKWYGCTRVRLHMYLLRCKAGYL